MVEGIYANYGDLAPLDKLIQLKKQYKYRLMVDESLAVGVLGKQGRGACEHFGLQSEDVEIRTASLGTREENCCSALVAHCTDGAQPVVSDMNAFCS